MLCKEVHRHTDGKTNKKIQPGAAKDNKSPVDPCQTVEKYNEDVKSLVVNPMFIQLCVCCFLWPTYSWQDKIVHADHTVCNTLNIREGAVATPTIMEEEGAGGGEASWMRRE